MTKKKILKITTIAVGILFIVWYARLPDYRHFNSMSFSDNSGRDTIVKIIVYKAHYNSVLYDMIADKHNKLNGTPSKLTLNLFFSEHAIHSGKKPYRTVVFDYENHMEYIYLDTINDTKPQKNGS